MKKIILTFFLFQIFQIVHSQDFTNWITGDSADFVTTEFQSGIVLAGGGGDNDDAMIWMLNRAGGGDVVVIRASNSDGYNPYFYSELGVNVNSVETIRFNNANAANDPYVIQQIQNAEILFIAGGDQFDYYQYWKDTPIEDAINDLINVKQITVGGTSAGMAILGEAYYTPSGGSLDAEEGLGNPFHPDVDILGKGDFVNIPILTGVVTDTHYDDRDRAGRHLVFMARLATEHNQSIRGIACNEYTAVCIDENGIAKVFGETPTYPDYAYFLETKCHEDLLPEIMEENTPLTWNKSNSAVVAYKIPGTITGENTFDLNDWETGIGGEWQYWYAIEGNLSQDIVEGEVCDLVNVDSELAKKSIEIYPNPFDKILFIETEKPIEITIHNQLGKALFAKRMISTEEYLNLDFLASGIYSIAIHFENQFLTKKVVKK